VRNMLLEMKNICKYFGPVKALSDVNLEVSESEIHGLLGENGAGKSTLMNILAGTFPATSGEIYFNNELIKEMTIHKSVALGIRFIHQELNLINDLKVYENLFLGEEIKNRFGLLDKKTMINKSMKVFEKMKINIEVEELADHLDTSRKQLVEIAKALLFECKLIIMDEPTSALTNKEIQSLFEIMRILKNEGVTIIYISHKMPEIFDICDKYTVLRDGKFIQSGNFKDIDEKKATELLVGRRIIDSEIQLREVSKEELLVVKNLSSIAFNDVSFDLHKGEVIAITGLHGDGRGELADALFGAAKIESGSVIKSGKLINTKKIKYVMDSGIAMVPRNRKERSIIKDMSIMDNLSIAYFANKHKKLFVKNSEELKRYNKHKDKMGIKAGNPSDLVTSLSGGNQQKIIISRWLEIESDVYILDNPTQGIDVGAKFEIYKLINNMANEGKGIIVFTSEFPEIWKVADRCIVMYKGKINAILTRDKLTEHDVMLYATGSNLEVRK